MGIIAAVCALLLPLLQWWISKSPERKVEQRNDEIQSGRFDIATGNAGAVSQRIDSLPQAANSTPKLGDSEDTKRRLKVLGID